MQLLERYPVRSSFWGVAFVDDESVLRADESCEVLVIGGGLAGLSTAYHLLARRPAMSVILLEAEYCGFGASGRNFCNVAQLSKTDIGELTGRFGDEAMRFVVRHQERMFADFQQLIETEGIDCEFAVADLLHLAYLEADAARLRQIRDAHRVYGYPSQLLNREEARARINLRALAALSTGWNGYAQPFLFTRGLRAAAVRHGLRVHEGSRVVGLQRVGGVWVATTPHGSVSAPWCVLATNASTPSLGFELGRISPSYTYALATQPLEPEAFERIGWSPLHRLINDFGEHYWYMQMRPNRQLLVGDATRRPTTGDGVTLPAHDNVAAYRRIHAEIVTRFPWLEDVTIDCAWGGPLDMTAHRLPTVAPVDDGLWLNAGYSARGYLMAALSGRVIAPSLTGVRSNDDADYARFAQIVLSGET